jgi:Tfp pilus assembly protein PilF
MIGDEQIEGRVFFPRGDRPATRPIVRLKSLSSPDVVGVTDENGSFRFTHLRPDAYTVIVDGGDQYENGVETVTVGDPGSVPAQGLSSTYVVPTVYQVQIYLVRKAAAAIPANVPAAARDLYQKAVESARVGDQHKAIEQLKLTIEQAPSFTLAYRLLAEQYLKTGHGDKAIETLRTAIQQDPDDTGLRLNYGMALVNQKQFADAETALRLTIQKGKSESPAAAYYLGLALMGQHKIDEARSAFETVVKNGGDDVALAHRYLGGIYWRNKEYRKAADELEKYLKLEPKAADSAKIRDTIKELRHKV